MSEIIIAKLIDLAFNALSVGLERDAIISKVKAMEDAGAKPDEIAAALVKMRDDAITATQAEIDKTP